MGVRSQCLNLDMRLRAWAPAIILRTAKPVATTPAFVRLLIRRFLQVVVKNKLNSGKVVHCRRRPNRSNQEHRSLAFRVKAGSASIGKNMKFSQEQKITKEHNPDSSTVEALLPTKTPLCKRLQTLQHYPVQQRMLLALLGAPRRPRSIIRRTRSLRNVAER
jgi:hypothetical protein